MLRPLSVAGANTRAFLQKFVDDGQANGAIACVWRNGRIDLEVLAGWMDSDLKVPMRRDAIFNIASLSKPITGVSAMMMIEQGKTTADNIVAALNRDPTASAALAITR